MTGGPLQKLYFQRKLQIEKTAIETNYSLNPVVLEFFFRKSFFQCETVAPKCFYINLPMIQLMELQVVLYSWVYQVLIINYFIFVSIPVNKHGSRLTKFQLADI